ncbi:NAD(P)/FAD-dependent oxidoreductase [Sphingosinicella sp. LHD-64]|uniref:flavin monoamine oxidase family protein n=1 Tax=Sphingosinicella sp. LHD-64 TaxID=3072139 RepID=UPI00280D85E6|nr:NAD(P)/FAD-dependent oxidoreductase [Sphingosinicella sp. LHD-64]MDQ8756330.1 NAD(P)/FAD-dependent oxidoreductase [Sphingosinicella sp. LHD-64]
MSKGVGIWRALDRARAMNLKANGEALARLGGDGITRRRVLAGLAGGAGALLLPRAPAFGQTPPRIAIVGGGLAGLSALDTLASRGVAATLHEARGAVGGRTRSVRGVFAPDYAFDEGGQLVNSDHADMIRLIRRFGIRMVDRKAFGPTHEVQIGRDSAPVEEADLARALRGIAAEITRDSDRLDRDYEAVAREIDAMSVADYLDRRELPAGDARDAIEAGIRTEYGAEPRDASALELLFNLPTVDGARVTRVSLSDERYVISGGSDQIAGALGRLYEGAIRLNRRLTRLDVSGPEVRLAFADGEEVRADRVILALPAPLIREVEIDGPLPPLWRDLIGEIELGRNEKLVVGYETQPWRDSLGYGGALWAGQPFAAGWDAASFAPAEGQGAGAICYFLGGDQVAAAAASNTADLAARFSDAARRAIPALPQPIGIVRRTRWCDDPLTKGAYINFRPGQITRFGSLMTVEEEQRVRASGADPLFFAGEWLSDAWPGYMNGAVQTGRVAAEAALAPAWAETM